MRCEKRLAIGLLSAGLSVAWAGGAAAQEKPAGEPGSPPPRPERAEGPPPGGPEGRERGFRADPQRMADRMRERLDGLNLSEEQRTKIDGILKKAKGELDAAMSDSAGLAPQERAEKVRGVMGPVHEQVMDVLDETQREKFRETLRSDFRGAGPREGGGPGRFQGRRGPGGPGPGPGGPGAGPGGPEGRRGDGPGDRRGPGMMMDRLRDNLGKLELTDEQQKKVDALLADTRKKLSDLQTEAEKAQAEMRGKVREAMESSRNDLNTILTEEQRQKLREMMPPPQAPGEAGPGRPGSPGERGRRPEGGPPREGGRRPEGGPPPAPPQE